ncbi:MAG TPA: M23 family metallopeptidase [Candidatus Krumholzibacteria bacterium]|nr:M23 family metallopeptidase [Candidatus Krumholzibacteria bacterium]HPD71437.1 M23 family metallopeptidase [Candidatus Krumholzibacteria bacterium]HRY41630.1 M23 family metallopeptidase [Candidatus Krumholzibacteria bacterium]
MTRACALLVVLLGTARMAVAEPPIWPLDLTSRYLTGNFMEPREGRFHTGLDLKTNSRTGYAVLAVRNGWISRIRVAEGGYGKAVYLTCGDGMSYVYGHLERLADPLRARVSALQARLGRYAVDIGCEPGEFPVRQGEVLALSGQSGTAGPHLHFEVRGPDGQPRDPLAAGFAAPDSLAPEIVAVRAVLLDEPSRTLLVGGGAPLSGRLPDLVAGSGRVRFCARIVERSDHLRHRLEACRVRLLVDGEEVFAAANDSVHWDRVTQQRLEYVRTELGWERWLAGEPRLTLSGRRSADWLELGVLPPGSHEVRLVACDRAGNAVAVDWGLEVPADAESSGWRGWPASAPVVGGEWRVVAGPASRGGSFAVGPVAVEWRCGRLRDPVPARRLQLAGLEPLADAVEWRTPGAPLLAPVPVVLPRQARPGAPVSWEAADVAVYRLDDGAWSFVAAPRTVAGEPAFDLAGPGVHALLRDTAPPVIATATVAKVLAAQTVRRRHGIALSRWPELRIPVGDHGSGIDWPTLAVSLDGAPLVAEPDPPRDRILVELPDTTGAGDHRVQVVVSDRAGRASSATLAVTLVEAAADGRRRP